MVHVTESYSATAGISRLTVALMTSGKCYWKYFLNVILFLQQWIKRWVVFVYKLKTINYGSRHFQVNCHHHFDTWNANKINCRQLVELFVGYSALDILHSLPFIFVLKHLAQNKRSAFKIWIKSQYLFISWVFVKKPPSSKVSSCVHTRCGLNCL